ncbi:MAG: LysR family transcriptional regulator [Byssovorax sp.]
MTTSATPLPNLAWLHAFVVFAEHLHFTRAAKALGLSQPALHMQIKKLGEELGVTLYARRGQRVELTPDGRRVLAFGRALGAETAAFLARLHGREEQGPVVLAAGEGSFLYLLGEPIRAFLAAGKAPLRLLTRDREATVAAVIEGEAHLGVAPLDGVPEGLRGDRLASVGQVLAMPASHPLARRRAIKLGDLAGARLVVPAEGKPQRAMLAQAMLAEGVPWEPAVEAHGWEPILHFVKLGAGLAVVNACCRLPRGVVSRPIPALPVKTYLVLRRGALGGPAEQLRQRMLAAGAALRAA